MDLFVIGDAMCLISAGILALFLKFSFMAITSLAFCVIMSVMCYAIGIYMLKLKTHLLKQSSFLPLLNVEITECINHEEQYLLKD